MLAPVPYPTQLDKKENEKTILPALTCFILRANVKFFIQPVPLVVRLKRFIMNDNDFPIFRSNEHLILDHQHLVQWPF